MDIFFCDLCCARVADSDLRTGRGQRSRWDVICNSCLEQGLGKEWLGTRQKSNRMVAIASGVGSPVGKPGDRVATLEEDDNEPQESAPAPAATPADGDPMSSTAKVPALSNPQGQQLASAASMFSALGNTRVALAPSAERAGDDADDDDLEDRATQTPAEQLSPAGGAPVLGEAPFALKTPDNNGEKADTVHLDEAPSETPAETEPPTDRDTKKPGTASATRRKSEKSDKDGERKSTRASAKGKSSRAAAPRQDHSKLILYLMVGALVVIVLAFGGVVAKKHFKGARPTTTTQAFDDTEIKAVIAKATATAIAALQSGELGQLRAARDVLQAAQQKLYAYSDKLEKDGNAAANVNAHIEKLRVSDMVMHIRPINDKIQALEHQQ